MSFLSRQAIYSVSGRRNATPLSDLWRRGGIAVVCLSPAMDRCGNHLFTRMYSPSICRLVARDPDILMVRPRDVVPFTP